MSKRLSFGLFLSTVAFIIARRIWLPPLPDLGPIQNFKEKVVAVVEPILLSGRQEDGLPVEEGGSALNKSQVKKEKEGREGGIPDLSGKGEEEDEEEKREVSVLEARKREIEDRRRKLAGRNRRVFKDEEEEEKVEIPAIGEGGDATISQSDVIRATAATGGGAVEEGEGGGVEGGGGVAAEGGGDATVSESDVIGSTAGGGGGGPEAGGGGGGSVEGGGGGEGSSESDAITRKSAAPPIEKGAGEGVARAGAAGGTILSAPITNTKVDEGIQVDEDELLSLSGIDTNAAQKKEVEEGGDVVELPSPTLASSPSETAAEMIVPPVEEGGGGSEEGEGVGRGGKGREEEGRVVDRGRGGGEEEGRRVGRGEGGEEDGFEAALPPRRPNVVGLVKQEDRQTGGGDDEEGGDTVFVDACAEMEEDEGGIDFTSFTNMDDDEGEGGSSGSPQGVGDTVDDRVKEMEDEDGLYGDGFVPSQHDEEGDQNDQAKDEL